MAACTAGSVPLPPGGGLENKRVADRYRQVCEQVLCLQCVLRKIRYSKDLLILRCAQDFACGLPLRSRPQSGSSSLIFKEQERRKPSRIRNGLARGICLDDGKIRDSEWKSGDGGHGRL